MNNSTRTELLIRYLDQELSEAERAEVEAELASDAAASEELERLRVTRNLVKGYALRQQVYRVHGDMMQELRGSATATSSPAPVRKMFTYAMRIAASVLVILSVTALYQYLTFSSAKFFDQNYSAYEAPTMRGSAGSTIQSLYNERNWKEVVNRFERSVTHTTEEWFLAANAYLQLNQLPQAIGGFQAVQKQNAATRATLFQDDAEYYLAMAYLKNNEPASALPILEAIHRNPDHAYHDKVSSWDLIRLRRLK